MTFAEFLGGIGENRSEKFLADFDFSEPIPGPMHDRFWELFKHYLIVGGLPKAILAYAENKADLFQGFTEARNRQHELYLAYLADMAKHAGKANSMHIERVFQAVPAQMARTLDASAPKFTFKDVVKGIRGYVRLIGPIDWLKAAGLIHKVPIVNKAWVPMQAFTDESVFKLYSFDVGMLGSMGGLAPKTILDYDFGSYKGYMAENFALQELVSLNEGLPFSWKEGTAEVEFLFDMDGKIVPLEIKSGWVTQAKSLKVFTGKYRPEKRVTLSAKNFSRNREMGTYQVPLYLAGRLREMLALP
jgi:predicted AAA+ superfamily ATPase